ncbi:hypothetical protein [Microbacterium thalli]|uniref:hypothetical protein n=1 Tax=Microbacterium thalli TaxID=3027921 RepID=UPI0023671811|nr:hypothetical protein [Microbacterium thalli]MDD7930794.1 hypothetical protein [Microbacterium thalli]
MTENFDGIAASKSERRARFIAGLDHSSLENLATSAAAEERRAAQAEEQRRKQEQDDLRSEWVSSYLDATRPALTQHFAETFEIPKDSPLLAELHWRFDPKELGALVFRAQGMSVMPISPGGNSTAPQLRADIGALTIQGQLRVNADGDVTGAQFSAVHDHSTVGIKNLEDLGRQIESARQRLADRS